MEASAGIVRKIGNRAAIVGRSRKPEGRQRSKISNGNKLIAGVDAQGLWVGGPKDLIADGISDLGIDNTSATSCGAPNFLGNSLTGCAGLKAVSARFSAAYWFVVGHDTMPAMGSRYAQTYPRVRTRFVAA